MADNINFSVKGWWNERKSKNQAAPLPFGVGPGAGITPVLDGTTIDVTNPFNPFGVTARIASNTTLDSIAASSKAGRAASSRRSIPATGVATLDGRFDMREHDWYWDVNGAYGQQQGQAEDVRQHQLADHLRQALGPVAQLHRALRAVQYLRRRGIDHPGDDRFRHLRAA